LTNFSVKPLRIALITGLLFSVLGFLYGVFIMIKRILNPGIQAGWSSIMAVILFASGIIMLLLGVIGEYVGRIFICINNAPQYVVRNTINTK
jgi:undecaprenyl-phosphate 4-deoxy-4-formamido-L-arabinose transferase